MGRGVCYLLKIISTCIRGSYRRGGGQHPGAGLTRVYKSSVVHENANIGGISTVLHTDDLLILWKFFFLDNYLQRVSKFYRKFLRGSNMIQKLYLYNFEDNIYFKWINSKTRRQRFLSVWMSWERTEEPMFPFPPKDSTLSRLFSTVPPAKTTLKRRSNAANNPRVMQKADKQLIIARTGRSFYEY